MAFMRTLAKATRDILAPAFAKLYSLDTLFLTGRELPISAGGFAMSGTDSAYQASAICYACIRRKSLDVSGVPLMFLRDPNDADSIIDDPMNPVVRLFDNPHPLLSTEELMQYIVTWLEMRGEVFGVFDDSRRPRMWIPWTDPLAWREEMDASGQFLRWMYRGRGGLAASYFDSDIFRHRYINPAKPYRGQSPLQAAGFPYRIETDGDRLQSALIATGGEQGNVYFTDKDISPKQQRILLANIRSRRQGVGQPLRDILLANGVRPADPRFTKSDLDVLRLQEPSRDKLCAVYGMTSGLIFHDDAPNFATFRERLKIYWTQTAIPLMRGIEHALDRFFVEGPPRSGVFVRFDLGKVEALQDELTKRLDAAKALFDMRVPLSVINDRLGLRLSVEDIPGADEPLAQQTLVPVSVLLSDFVSSGGAGSASKSVRPPNGPVAPPRTTDQLAIVDDLRALAEEVKAWGEQAVKRQRIDAKTLPTRQQMIDRATDPHRVVARERRLERLRRKLANDWRLMMAGQKKRFAAAADSVQAADADAFKSALEPLRKELLSRMVDTTQPIHEKAAAEGVASIQELVDADAPKDLADMLARQPDLGADTLDAVRGRTKYIEDMEERLWSSLMGDVESALTEGTMAEDVRLELVGKSVKHNFNVSINRSATIARTEVGTMYSVARFHETKRAGFNGTEWLTAADENVRGEDPDDPFDHAICDGESRMLGERFPCGLRHPMEEGGEPGNVINCRCTAIPALLPE